MKKDSTSEQKPQPVESLKETKVLLMDPNVIQQKLVSKMLGKIGCPVYFTGDFKEARNILDTNKIDLILLDVQMQKSNGFDIRQIAREKEKSIGKRIPIVALTDKAMKIQREKCMADGMDEYLPKPVFEKELCRVIEKLSGNHHQKDS